MTLALSKAPPHHSEPAAPVEVPERWPMSWSRRELLLERQHRILIDRIADLISDDPVEAEGQRGSGRWPGATPPTSNDCDNCGCTCDWWA
jgi:hypothetical protein